MRLTLSWLPARQTAITEAVATTQPSKATAPQDERAVNDLDFDLSQVQEVLKP